LKNSSKESVFSFDRPRGKKAPMLNNAEFHPPKLKIGKRDNVPKTVADFFGSVGQSFGHLTRIQLCPFANEGSNPSLTVSIMGRQRRAKGITFLP
jgi:hypothetical protein